jgi:hypothetical protein
VREREISHFHSNANYGNFLRRFYQPIKNKWTLNAKIKIKSAN